MEMKKLHSYSNKNKIFKGLFFMVEGFISETVQNVPFFNRQVGSLQNNTSLGADLLMC